MSASNLTPFRNEPFADFTVAEHRQAQQQALDQVRGELGREYPLLIAGQPITTPEKIISRNPSRPDDIVGVHQKATVELANHAVEEAHAYFPEYASTTFEQRAGWLLRAAEIMRRRKYELNAWLIYEAGKPWSETEPDTSEAIDFCEYYARQALKLTDPEPLLQMPGERGQLRYLPLGVGVIIPPWNFPLAILVGMAGAALVTGNTVIIKPSSDTPTIGAKFAEILIEAGFPARSFCFLPGSGGAIGDLLVQHPKTRFVSFTGSRDVGLRINELAAKPQKGQLWIKRVLAEMGGKDAIIVDRETDVDKAAEGVVASAFGYSGQKCSACSRVIVDESVYNGFVERLREKVAKLRIGPADSPDTQVGPVINERAQKSILSYIETGKREGRLVAGGSAVTEPGYLVAPTVIADVEPDARIFQEEIFGPVLAVTRARDFDHALELANNSEYGLTGAVYSDNPEKIRRARDEFFVGNLYINRKCTGAMVGVHPFGGFNMSGTDSKAGGPDYLLQFVQAKSIAEKIA